MNYRPEIDGLRSVAVVPVILFHAGASLFSGGFIGVDVFFVISGYLITTILLNDIEAGRFSLVTFYERRARRILPALFVVMLACIPFAWAWMLPEQMEEFGRSLIAVVLFVSNVLFWREAGYFSPAAEEKPLLHTWSLAVEEQYYLLFPILLFFAWRLGRKAAFTIIGVIALISLGLSEVGWRKAPTANFYLTVFRAWELFAGSLVAFFMSRRSVAPNQLFSLAGLAMVIVPIFAFDDTTPSPGLITVVPVAGVALIILFGSGETLVRRMLGSRIPVAIGLVSYSAYLWHQPLFAFARLRYAESFDLALGGALVVTTFALAFLSWRYVERPFRDRSSKTWTRPRIFAWSALGMVALAAAGLGAHLTQGFASRLSETERAFVAALDNRPDDDFRQVASRAGFGSGKPKLLIIGDSFAKDLYEGLRTSATADLSRLDVVLVTIPRRCKNVLRDTPDLAAFLDPSDKQCQNWKPRVGDPHLDALVREADLTLVRSAWDVLPTREMPRTYDHLDALAPGRVAFLEATTFGDVKYNSLGALRARTERVADIDTNASYTVVDPAPPMIDLIHEARSRMTGRAYFHVNDAFCETGNGCRVIDEDGAPLTPDGGHTTARGETIMVEMLFDTPDFRRMWETNLGSP